MTAVYKLDPLQDSRWLAFVGRHPGASVFHTTGWLEALHKTYGYRAVALTTSPPTGQLENALLFARIRSWLTGRRIVSLPFSDHCEPLFDSSEELDFVLDYLRTEMDSQQWKYLELRPLSWNYNGRAKELGFQPSALYYLHRLDLQPKLSDIFEKLDKNSVQRRIHHAERAGLTEKCGRSEDLLKGFYDLLVLTRKRHKIPPQPYVWFRNLLDSMGSSAEIRMACKKEGTPVAAILTLRLNDKAVYKYGCSDTQFNNLGATPLLLWRAIENAKATGAREFDLGRSEENNTGLIAFKNNWVKNPTRLIYWRFPPPPPPGAKEGWKLKLAKRLFACMPNSVLTAAGRSVYRHIG